MSETRRPFPMSPDGRQLRCWLEFRLFAETGKSGVSDVLLRKQILFSTRPLFGRHPAKPSGNISLIRAPMWGGERKFEKGAPNRYR
jgi:hypothetical protein